MELFHEDGHLTDAALCALTAMELDELQRLEVGEHLDFCAPCFMRYMEKLDEIELETAPETLAPKVQARLRLRRQNLLLRQFATVAAAACLVLGMWMGGVFSALGAGPQRMEERYRDQAAQQTQPPATISQRMNAAAAELGSNISGFFSGLLSPSADPAEGSANSPSQPGTAGVEDDSQPPTSGQNT